MHAVTYLLTPKSGPYGRMGGFFQDEGIWLVAVHKVDILSDGSVVTQFEIADAPRPLAEIFEETADWVYDYQVAAGDERDTLQLHFEPAGIQRDVIDLHRSYATVFDYPIEVADHASQSFRVTEVGDESELRELLEETRQTIDVTVEKVGDFEPVSTRRAPELSDQQASVLAVAVELGYYDVPRNTTYADIAEAVDSSASAVGQHLRRAEAQVMRGVAGPMTEAGEATGE